ncbi:GEVED domain-containing protein [Planctomycetaceae bacterium SH139]
MLFNPFTHIEIANDVRMSVIDDGQITIEGTDYPVHPKLVDALENYPSYFYGGAVGPDGFPDLVAGQQVIHPQSINIFNSHVLDKAWAAQNTEGDVGGYTQVEQHQILAWAYGFASHSIGDLWVHTLMDEIADGPFPGFTDIVDPTNEFSRSNALRHIIAESYIADATPGFDGNISNSYGEGREILPDGDVSGNASKTKEIDAPGRFVFDAMLYDPPNLVAQVEEELFRVTDSDRVAELLLELRETSFDPDETEIEFFTAGQYFTADMQSSDRLTRVDSFDVDSGVAQSFRLQADFRDFVVRHEGSELVVSETVKSRGLLVDNFLIQRKTLVDVLSELAPEDAPTGSMNEPLQDLVDSAEEALRNLARGDGFDFSDVADNLRQIYDDLVLPFEDIFQAISDGNSPEEVRVIAMASTLGGLGGGTTGDYLEYWIANIDRGIQQWPAVGQSLARAMFDPQVRRDGENEEGRTSGPDLVDPDFLNDRADEEDAGLFAALLSELRDPNSDGDREDSYISNNLISMFGMPNVVGRTVGLIGEFGDQLERDVLEPIAQLPLGAINPFSIALDALKEKVKDWAVDLILDAIEKRYGVDVRTIDAVLSGGSSRMDVRSITIATGFADNPELHVPLFRPNDHERLDRILGFFGTDHLEPLEGDAGALFGAGSDVLDVQLNPNPMGALKDNAVFDKETFAPYANSVMMTEMLLLQEWDPLRLENGQPPEPGDRAKHPRVLSQLLSDLTGTNYDFAALVDNGQHGGNLLSATLPGVMDEYGVSVSNSDNYRAPFDHDVWFNSMDSDHQWRSNSASTLSNFYRYQSRTTGAIGESFQEPITAGGFQYELTALVPGREYTLQTDWLVNNQLHEHGSKSPASAAEYNIFVGSTLVETVSVNQRENPGDTIASPNDVIVYPTGLANSYEAHGQGWRHLTTVTADASGTIRVRVDNANIEGEFLVAGRLRLVNTASPTSATIYTPFSGGYTETSAIIYGSSTSNPTLMSDLDSINSLGTLPASVLSYFAARDIYFGDEYYQQLAGDGEAEEFSSFFTDSSPLRRGYVIKRLDDGSVSSLRQFEIVRVERGEAAGNGQAVYGRKYVLTADFTGPEGSRTSANIEITQPWDKIYYDTGAGNFALWESDKLRDNVFRTLFFDFQNGQVIGDYLSNERQAIPGVAADDNINFPNLGDFSTSDPSPDLAAPVDFTPYDYTPAVPEARLTPSAGGVDLIVSGNQTFNYSGDRTFRSITGNGDTTQFDNVTIIVDGTATIAGYVGGLGLLSTNIVADKIVVEPDVTVSSRAIFDPSLDHMSDASLANSGNITFLANHIEIGDGANILAHAPGFVAGNITMTLAANENSVDNILADLLDNFVGDGLEYFAAESELEIGAGANIRGAFVDLSVTATTERELELTEQAFAYRTTASLLGNFDDDPELEWVIATDGDGILMYDWDPGEGFFGSATQIETGAMRFTSLSAIENSSGTLDIVAGSSDTADRLYSNTGSGLSFTRTLGLATVNTSAIGTYEVGGNRRAFAATASGLISHNLDTGASTVIDAAIVDGKSVVVGDISGDGLDDIVVGVAGGADRLYIQNGAGFIASALPGDALDTRAIVLDNFDGDAALELIVATGTGELWLYQGASGGFATPVRINSDDGPGLRISDLSAGDLDGDGLQDLMVATDHQMDRFYLQQSDGSFVGRNIHSESLPTTTIAAGFLDDDGSLDIVIANDRRPGRFYLQDVIDGEMAFPVDTFIGVDRSIIGDARGELPVDVDSESNTFTPEEAIVVSADASAKISVGQGAWIEATKDLTLQTIATANASVRSSESAFGITFGRTRPESIITVLQGARLSSEETLTIDSDANSDLFVNSSVPTVGETVGISVSLAINEAVSDIHVRSGVLIDAGVLNVSADNLVSFSNTANASSFGTAEDSETAFAGTFASSFNQSNASAEVEGVITVDGTAAVTANANMLKNITRSYGWVSGGSSTSSGDEEDNSNPEDFEYLDIARQILAALPLDHELQELSEGLADGIEQGSDMIEGYVSGGGFSLGSTEFSSSDPENQIAASYAVVLSANDAAASIGTEAILQARDLTVTAEAIDLLQVSATATAGLIGSPTDLGIGGAAAYTTSGNQSSAFLGWDAVVDVRDTLDVSATSMRKAPVDPLTLTLAALGLGEDTQVAGVDAAQAYAVALIEDNDDDAEADQDIADEINRGINEALVEPLVDGLLEENDVGNSFVHSTAATDGGTGLSFAINYSGMQNAAYAGIAQGAQVNQRSGLFGSITNQDVNVSAIADLDSFHTAGTNSVLNVLVDDSAVAGGGVADVIMNENIAFASIYDRADVAAGRDITVAANSATDSTLIALAGGQATDTSVQGAATLNFLRNNALALVDDRAKLEAVRDVIVDADTTANVITVTPGLAVAETAIGIGAGLNYVVDRSEAYIADHHDDMQGICDFEDRDDRDDCGGLAGGRGNYAGRPEFQVPAGGYIGDAIGEVPDALPASDHFLGSVTAGRNVLVTANSAPKVWSVAIAGGVSVGSSGVSGPTSSISIGDPDDPSGSSSEGSSGLSIAGAFSLNVVKNITGAYIDDSMTVVAGDTVTVHADADADVISVGGALSIATDGGAGAGNYAQNHFLQYSKASVERARVVADTLDVEAHSRDRQIVIAPTAVGASDTAGAAGLVLATTRINTTAFLGEDTKLNVRDIDVQANNEMDLLPIVGLISIGGDGSYGANLGVTNVDQFVNAWVADSVSITESAAHQANLRVVADNDMNLLAVSAAISGSGESAFSGSANWVDLDHNVAALVDPGANLQLSNLLLDANDDINAKVIGGAVGLATGDAAVGLAFSQMSVDRTVLAEIGDGAVVDATASRPGLATFDAPTVDYSGIYMDANAIDNQVIVAVAGGVASGASVAPSVVVNRNESTVKSRIGDNTSINTTDDNVLGDTDQSIRMSALRTSRIVDVAGGVALGGDAGVGVAVDVMLPDFTTEVEIGNNSNVVANGNVQLFSGDASGDLSNSNLLSVVAGLGAAGTAGVAASVAVMKVDSNHTSAVVGSNTTLNIGGRLDVQSADDLKARFGSGSGGAGGTAGVGAANATLVHNATTIAELRSGTVVTAGGDVKVDANAEQEVKSVGIAFGAAGTVGVAGVAVVTKLTETTEAKIGTDVTVTSTGGSVFVDANNASDILTVAGSIGAGTVGASAGADVGKITKNTLATIASGASVTADENIFTRANTFQDITSVAAGVAAGIAGVALDASVHVIDINTDAFVGRDPNNAADTGGVTIVTAMGSVVVDANDKTEIDKIAGALAAGVGAGAGTAGVSKITKSVRSFVGDEANVNAFGLREPVEVSTGRHKISFVENVKIDTHAENEADPPAGQPTFAIDASEQQNPDAPLPTATEVPLPDFETFDLSGDVGGDSGGDDKVQDAALANQRFAEIETELQSGLIVTATQKDDIEVYTFSISGGVVAIAISAAANVINNDVTAFIGDSAIVNDLPVVSDPGVMPQQDVTVRASSDFYHMAIAGGAGLGVVAVAPAIAVSKLSIHTDAHIADNASVSALNQISVQADSEQKIVTVGAALAFGLVGVAGASSSFIFDDTTYAYVGSEAVLEAGGSVSIMADDRSKITNVAGSVAGGAVGVGASVGVIVVDKDTKAVVGGTPVGDPEGTFTGTGASITAFGSGSFVEGVFTGDDDGSTFETAARNGVIVQADSSEDILHVVAAGGGGFVGVAGAVAVALIDSDTTAELMDGTSVNEDAGDALRVGDVFVNAANDTSVRAYTIGAAGGFVGIGGAVDVGSVRNDVMAKIGEDTVVVAARDIEVNALQLQQLDSLVVSGSLAGAALHAGVSVWSLGSPINDTIANDNGNAIEGTELRSLREGREEEADQTPAHHDGVNNAENARGSLTGDHNADESGTRQANLGDFETNAADIGNSEDVAAITGAANDSLITEFPTRTQLIDRLDDETFVPRGAQAIVGEAALLTAGDDIHVMATSIVEAEIDVGGGVAGVVALGGSFSTLTINANAEVDVAGTLIAGDAIVIDADQRDNADVELQAFGGGLVAVTGARSAMNIGNTTTVNLADDTRLFAQTILIDARHAIDPVSTGTNVLVGGVIGAGVKLKRTLTGGSEVHVGEGVSIEAEQLRIRSHNDVRKEIPVGQLDLYGLTAGLLAVSVLSSTTDIGTDSMNGAFGANVNIGNSTEIIVSRPPETAGGAALIDPRIAEFDFFSVRPTSDSVRLPNATLEISATNDVNLRDRVNIEGGGVATTSHAYSELRAYTDSNIAIGNAEIRNEVGDVTLRATNDGDMRSTADVQLISAVSFFTRGQSIAERVAKNDITLNAASVSGEDLHIVTGRGSDQLASRVTTDAFSNVFIGSIIPIEGLVSFVTSRVDEQNSINVGAGTELTAFEDVNLIAQFSNNTGVARRVRADGDVVRGGFPLGGRATLFDVLDETTTNIDIATSSEVSAGATAESNIQVLHNLPLGVTLGDRLTEAEKSAEGYSLAIDYEYAPIVTNLAPDRIATGEIVQVGPSHTAGGIVGDFYEFLPVTGESGEPMVLGEQNYGDTTRWLALGSTEPVSSAFFVSSDRANIEEFISQFYVIKPVDVGDVTMTFASTLNLLLGQRDQLREWIAEYSGDTEAVVRYSVQLEEVEARLEQLGLSEDLDSPDGSVRVFPGGLDLLQLRTPKLAVSPGSIFIESDSQSPADFIARVDDGSLQAFSDSKVSIFNASPFTLVTDDIHVDDNVRLQIVDGELVAFDPGNVYANFTNLTDETESEMGNISIIQQTTNPLNNALIDLGFPDVPQDMYIAGSVINDEGQILIDNREGSIYVSGDIRGGGDESDVTIISSGDFSLNVDYLFHSGSNPRNLIDFAAVQGQLNLNIGNPPSVPRSVPDPASEMEWSLTDGDEPLGPSIPEAITNDNSSIIANGRILITARYLNVNGLIQSGVDSYDLTIEPSFDPLDAISGFTDDEGQLINGVVIGDGVGTETHGGKFVPVISGYFDPGTESIVIGDINPRAGSINLAGQILSTGNGRLVVANGYADVTIVNLTPWTLELGEIDLTTERSGGTITITDTVKLERIRYKQDGTNVEAQRFDVGFDAGGVPFYVPDGEAFLSSSYEIADEPADGPFFSWSLGTETARETAYLHQDRSFAGIDGLVRDRAGAEIVDERILTDEPLLLAETVQSAAQLGLQLDTTRFQGQFVQSLNQFVDLVPAENLAEPIQDGETVIYYSESGDPALGTWLRYVGDASESADLAEENFEDSDRWTPVPDTTQVNKDDLIYTEVLGPSGARDIATYDVFVETRKKGLGLRKSINTFINQKVRTVNHYSFALTASEPISIGFLSGSAAPTIDIDSFGDIRLSASLSVPSDIGVIELDSLAGSIISTGTAGIFGDVPEIRGARDVTLNIEGVPVGPSFEIAEPLMISASGDIDVRAFSTSIDVPAVLGIGTITSASGTVTLHGPDGILPASVTSTISAARIELFSSRGTIGTDKDDLRIETQRVGEGGLAAYADGNIYLTKTGGTAAGTDLEVEFAGDLVLVMPTSLPDTIAPTAAVTSVNGDVSITVETGDIIDGQEELFHGRTVATSADLTPSELTAITTLSEDESSRFSFEDFAYSISPSLHAAIAPLATFGPAGPPETSVPEQPNIIGRNIRLTTTSSQGSYPGGSIGQISAPEVIEYPLGTIQDPKHSALYALSEAEPQDIVGFRHLLLRYLKDPQSINLQDPADANFADPTVWEVVDPDFTTRTDETSDPVAIANGQTVAVDYDADNYGLYRYLGPNSTLRLDQQVYQETSLWEPVMADATTSDGEVEVQTGDLVLNEFVVRSITIQLIDDVDVQATGSVIADAAQEIALAGHGDLYVETVRSGSEIYLESDADLVDSDAGSLSVAGAGNVRLSAGGDIRGESGDSFVARVPNGQLHVAAGGDATVVQPSGTIVIEGTDYTVTGLELARANVDGALSVETLVGDMTVGQVVSGTSVVLRAPGSLLDGMPALHPSVFNVATQLEPEAFGGDVILLSGGVIGGTRQFMLSMPTGELTAASPGLMQITSLDDLTGRNLQTSDNIVLRVAGDLAIGQMAGNDVAIATNGDVTDANSFAYYDILANDITISSLAGSIGEPGNDLELDSVDEPGDAASVRLSARDDIFATETFGNLLIEQLVSELGNARLTVVDSAADGNDLVVPAGAVVDVSNGTVTLQAGDNVSIGAGFEAQRVFIRGDHRSVDPEGASIVLFNNILAEYIEIEGGDDDDLVTLTGTTRPVTVRLYGGDDVLKSGEGDDIADGGSGVDLLEGNGGNDRLMAGSGIGDELIGGPGDDILIGSDDGGEVDPDFFDAVRFGDVINGGPGNNRIAGMGGADLIIGGPNDDTIDSGFGKDYVLAGDGDDWIYPGASTDGDELIDGGAGSNTIYSGGEDLGLAQPTLPTGPVDTGRWMELRGSASGFGVSGAGIADSIAFADSPSVIATEDSTIAAWTDTRSGREQVYVARFDGTEWLPLGKDTFGGGVGDPNWNSTRPSLMTDADGNLLVAWEKRSEIGTDILVAQYDEGSDTWVAVGDSLGETGVSQTTSATSPHLISHAVGPVLAWTDTSTGVTQVYVRYFDGSDWIALGTSEFGDPSDVGGGISLAAPDSMVSEVQVVTDGHQIAIVWSQLDLGNRHIYLRELSGGVWQEIYFSGTFGGVSGNFVPDGERFHNQSPTAAFVQNELLVAWQSFSDSGGYLTSIRYVKTSNIWNPPFPLEAFATSTHDAKPKLVSNIFDAKLLWANDERSIYARRYDAGQWIESVAGDASGSGIQSGSIRIDSIVAASDPNGFATVAWIDSANNRSSFHLLVEDQSQVLPRVIDSTINGDISNTNRSGISSVTVRFSQPVTQVAFGGLRLRNHSDGSFIDLAGVLPSGNGTDTLTWDLLPFEAQITDGRYTAELLAADFAFANGGQLASSVAIEFHKRTGDVSGDTRVNFADFGIIGANFDPLPGIRYRNGDANGDGRVNFADYGIIGGNFNPLSLPASQLDFGDAPEIGTSYPTTLANDGARHLLGAQTYLGSSVDAEANGLPNTAADGDGADDDGIASLLLIPGQMSTVDVAITTPGTAFLNAWFDWNGDGDWDDVGEQVWQDVEVVDGLNSLNLFVPSTAMIGAVFARLRVSESTGYSYYGLAPTGEVEDYQLQVTTFGALRSRGGSDEYRRLPDLNDMEEKRKRGKIGRYTAPPALKVPR